MGVEEEVVVEVVEVGRRGGGGEEERRRWRSALLARAPPTLFAIVHAHRLRSHPADMMRRARASSRTVEPVHPTAIVLRMSCSRQHEAQQAANTDAP